MNRILASLVFVFFLSSSLFAVEYLASKSSTKYHKASCRIVKRINQENLLTFKTVEDAIKRGYEPCKICDPPIETVTKEHEE